MRWLLAPFALAAVSLLTACGSGKGPVAAAAAKSAKAQSMHILTLLQEQPRLGPSIQLNLEGDFNNVTERSSLVLDLSSLARSLGDTGASSQLFTGQEVSDSSAASSTFYLNVPFYSQSIPAAKAWLKFNFATLGHDQGVGLLEIAELNSTDPRGQLDVLENASAKFVNLGQDDINGTFATHYQGQIDLQEVLGKLNGPAKLEIESLLRDSNGTTVPYDVWIGDDGYVRRVAMQIPGSTGSQNVSLGLISDFSNYGTPVYVDLPPAGQVTDLTVRQMADLTAVLQSK
jgi:hypothetical protein